jgi:hypothetical protein
VIWRAVISYLALTAGVISLFANAIGPGLALCVIGTVFRSMLFMAALQGYTEKQIKLLKDIRKFQEASLPEERWMLRDETEIK